MVPAGRRPRRGRRLLLPVAPVPAGRGEVPLRNGQPRGGGGTHLSGDQAAGSGTGSDLRSGDGTSLLHEWWPLDAGEYAECDDFRGTLWSEEIDKAEDATTEASYKGGELDGLPAVLRRGRAWYLSTLPEPGALRELLAGIAAGAGARPVLDGLPDQVEAVRRGDLLFLLNHGREPVTVDVAGTHQDLLTGQSRTDRVTLGRYGVAVLQP